MKHKGPKYVFQVLKPYQEKLRELGVRKLGLFGSFAREESRETSDLDFWWN
jgi:predicted nucleotidyltransferase